MSELEVSKVGVSKLLVTQRKSGIGGTHGQRASLRTLGLRRIGVSVVREDKPEVRGLINRVRHLVEVEEVPE